MNVCLKTKFKVCYKSLVLECMYLVSTFVLSRRVIPYLSNSNFVTGMQDYSIGRGLAWIEFSISQRSSDPNSQLHEIICVFSVLLGCKK